MPRPMPLQETLPTVPDQTVPFQGLVYLRPLDIKILGTVPGYDNNIDNAKQPKVMFRQPEKTMYRASRKLLDKIQDEIIFRKHLPRQLEINTFLQSPKRKVIHVYDIPIFIK